MPDRKQLVYAVVCAALCLSSGCRTEKQTDADQATLEDLVAAKWGADNALLPSATTLVQYQADLGERWVVDFRSGEVTLECLWTADTDASSTEVLATMSCAVSNLYVSEPVLPGVMFGEQQRVGSIPSLVPFSQLERIDDEWTYKVRKGDTLSAISAKFRVSVEDLMQANALANPDRIRSGKDLVIPEPRPHIHMPGEIQILATEPILAGQILDSDSGRVVDSKTIGEFGRKIIAKNGVEVAIATGADGVARKVSRSRFMLADGHLEVRANRYYGVVKRESQRFGHDPAVIMAMIHTESAFNPMARSAAGAYGLMQIVPSSGGREAYRWLYRKDVAPSRAYLLKPKSNIELGAAYIQVLQEKVFKGVKEADSRLYCSVAAYNCGGGNVARAFTGQKSVQRSIDTINHKSAEQVLQKLKSDAPHKETRDYIQRVFDRTHLYREPAWDESG